MNFKNFKVPSADYFISQVPKIESFEAEAKSKLESVTGKLPSADKLKSDMEQKILDKVGGVDIYNLPEPKSTGELAQLAGEKLGINVDSAKIDGALEQIDAFKASMTEKAIEGVKTVAEKIGIKVPDIPTEDEIAQMIIDTNPETAADIESKIASIESFIESKLS